MEEQGAEPVFFRTQRQTKHSIGPLEVDSSDCHVASYRLDMEEVVLDLPATVLLPGVHD